MWFEVGRVNQMRGIHECNICRTHRWPLLPLNQTPSLELKGELFYLGNWEIWLPGRDDIVYASPALIIHYVTEHQYRPPPEFILAVMNDEARHNWNGQVEFHKRAGRPQELQ